MSGSDGIPRPTKEPGRRMMSVMADRPSWLIVLLLLLTASGFIISWLAGPLGAAMAACLLALWAVPTVAVAVALIKLIGIRWSKRRQDKFESLSPAADNPEPVPEKEASVTIPNGKRRRRSRRWVLSIESFIDEGRLTSTLA
jgi:hypothetical protein